LPLAINRFRRGEEWGVTDGTKIFPRNLTARAAHVVAGNPDISRPEDSVGNCFPGLDMDVRNLDRRFFPGLVFEFISDGDTPEPDRLGALLLYPDGRGDTDLQPEYLDQLEPADRALIAPLRAELFKRLIGDLQGQLADGTWYLDWIEQGGKRISTRAPKPDNSPLDGIVVWRLVRGLTPGEVSIGLSRRGAPGRAQRVELKGWRRLFTGPRTGVLSRAYQPGELMMSMCSPWQHDFRDCACHYWASNRPDVVHGEIEIGEPTLPGGLPADPVRALTRLDWMRADRSRAAAAAVLNTLDAIRPFQMDHFQINRTWQDLNIVLNNTEIGSLYLPPTSEIAEPYGSPAELYGVIRDTLAPLEMTLALEYIYASFSMIPRDAPADPRWPGLGEHAEFVRQYLLLTAVNEMQHLRWANELLWVLARTNSSLGPYAPVLRVAPSIPMGPGQSRPSALRALEPEVLESFIAVEEPSGTIDGAYARVVATLSRPEYPPHLRDLAGRIISEGTEHFTRFREIRAVLKVYKDVVPAPYLRPLLLGSPGQAAAALGAYQAIVNGLSSAYAAMAVGDLAKGGAALVDARQAMTTLLAAGETLAGQNLGIPFWPPA
jgi:hypothetical protein